VQEMLRRAAKLNCYDVLFTRGDPLYIDKARRFPGRTFVIGADALLRMLDPKWGTDPEELLQELRQLRVEFLVFGRQVDGVFVDARQAIAKALSMSARVQGEYKLFVPVDGRWDISSTAARARKLGG